MNARKLWILLILIALSVIITLIQLDSFKKGNANIVEKTISNGILPVQSFFSNLGRNISSSWHSFTRGVELEKENKQLKEELYALKEEQEISHRVQEENKELRKLLDLAGEQKGKVIAGEIIARDPDNWFRSIKVNKGKKQGVTTDMIALSSEGIVGRVVETADDTSSIRLIFDCKSAIPAQVVSSGALGVVYGEGKDTLIMKYISADAEVKVGDQIITSRLSQVYPPGKIIGTVTKIYGRDNILYKAVQVKPSIEFGNLEYLMLIDNNI